jgi:hypothetical protein
VSLFRNTDVKKHLGRVVPRSVTPHAKEGVLPTVDAPLVPSLHPTVTVPATEAAESSHKTEAV